MEFNPLIFEVKGLFCLLSGKVLSSIILKITITLLLFINATVYPIEGNFVCPYQPKMQ